MSTTLKKIREKIDLIDLNILKLLCNRAKFAKDIAKVKTKLINKSAFRPDRESQIIRKILNANPGPLSNNHLLSIYKEIISSCLSLESDVKVSFLGPIGSFSGSAMKKFFGSTIKSSCNNSISDIFNDVITNSVDYGVIPIENSNQGSIKQTLELLIKKPVLICGEVNLTINHCLLSKLKSIKMIRKVYSHEQTFLQCRDWLQQNLPDIEKINVSSNSEAAKKVQKLKNSAAIAGLNCSNEYSLNVIKKNIHDSDNNTTRFIIIGNQNINKSGSDKTSIIVSTSNKPGSLFTLLEPLSKSKISMTKIESIPMKTKNWEYLFFLDIEGHIEDIKIKKALDKIKKKCSFYKNLGSYPKSV